MSCPPIGWCFNPRARVGRDRRRGDALDLLKRFNPRARVGRDNARSIAALNQVVFQSTRPRGARPLQDNSLIEKALSAVVARTQ